MNDKNFIEELRQKREEYGVTQTRLAVACVLNRKLDTLKMNIKLQNKINNRWKNMPLKTA